MGWDVIKQCVFEPIMQKTNKQTNKDVDNIRVHRRRPLNILFHLHVPILIFNLFLSSKLLKEPAPAVRIRDNRNGHRWLYIGRSVDVILYFFMSGLVHQVHSIDQLSFALQRLRNISPHCNWTMLRSLRSRLLRQCQVHPDGG